jgi:hypothetical protein
MYLLILSLRREPKQRVIAVGCKGNEALLKTRPTDAKSCPTGAKLHYLRVFNTCYMSF